VLRLGDEQRSRGADELLYRAESITIWSVLPIGETRRSDVDHLSPGTKTTILDSRFGRACRSAGERKFDIDRAEPMTVLSLNVHKLGPDSLASRL